MSQVFLAIASLCFTATSPEATSIQLGCQKYYATCMKQRPKDKTEDEWLLNCLIAKELSDEKTKK